MYNTVLWRCCTRRLSCDGAISFPTAIYDTAGGRRCILLAIVLSLCLWTGVSAETDLIINNVLVSQPQPINTALFSEELNLTELIEADDLKRRTLWPRTSTPVPWRSGETLFFTVSPVADGVIDFAASKPSPRPHIAYAFFYLETERYQKFHLQINSRLPFGIFVNGEQQMINDFLGDDPVEKSCDLFLKRGNHRILLKTVRPQDADTTEWKVEIDLSAQFNDSARTTTDSERLLYRYDDLRFFHSITGLAISPDGKTGAIVMSSRGDGFEPRTTFIELWDLKSKSVKSTISMGRSTFSPLFSQDSRKLFFRTGGDGTNLWIMDLDTGRKRALLRGERAISHLTLNPDGKTLYFIQNVGEEESDGEAYTRYAELRDKLTDWLTERAVYALSVESGAKWRLTAEGDFSILSLALSPQGDRIAYSRMVPINRRPFFKTELWL